MRWPRNYKSCAPIPTSASRSATVPASERRDFQPTSAPEITDTVTEISPTPTNTPEIKIDFDKLSVPNIPSITLDGTYDAYLHVQKPRSEFQEFLREKYSDDLKRYVQAINADNKFRYKEAFIKFVSGVFGPDYLSLVRLIPDTIDLYKKAWESAKSENDFHVPLEAFFEFKMGDIINQTEFSITPEFSILTDTGKIIPFGNIDELVMDDDSLEILRQEFSAGKETHPLEWTMQEGPYNSGYVDINVNLPLELVWDVEMGRTLSRASILGDSLYVVGTSLFELSTLTGEVNSRLPLRFVRGTPAVIEDLVVALGSICHDGCDYNSALYAFDPDSGNRVWSKSLYNPKTPLIDGETVYVVDNVHGLQSINIHDGSLYWDFNRDYLLDLVSSPKITDDAIYFLGHMALQSVEKVIERGPEYELYSLSKNGNLNWKADAAPYLGRLGGSGSAGYLRDYEVTAGGNSIPILAGNFLIWENRILRFKDDDSPQTEICLEAFNLETRSVALDHCIGTEPVSISSKITDGKDVYVSTENQILRYTADGDELRQLPTITLENNILDSVLTKDYLFAATDVGITAIDRRNPDVRHKIHDFEYGQEIERIHMSISGGDLYVVVNHVVDSPRGQDHILKFSPSQATK